MNVTISMAAAVGIALGVGAGVFGPAGRAAAQETAVAPTVGTADGIAGAAETVADPFAASDAPRVLIVAASPRNAMEADLAKRVESRLSEHLARAGIVVVAEEHVRGLERRREALARAWVGGGRDEVASPIERSRVADVLAELRIREASRALRQGRHLVKLSVTLDLIDAAEARRHASLEFDGAGRSLKSYPDAFDRAVADLCGQTEDGPGPVLVSRVRRVRDASLERGSLFTVGVRVRGPGGRTYLSRFERGLSRMEGVEARSVFALATATGPGDASGGRSTKDPAADRRGVLAEYRLRFAGGVGELRDALRALVANPSAPGAEVSEPALVTYRRRIDVVTWTTPPGPTVGEDLATGAAELFREIAGDHRGGLEGRSIRIDPVTLPAVSVDGGRETERPGTVRIRDRIDLELQRATSGVGAVSVRAPVRDPGSPASGAIPDVDCILRASLVHDSGDFRLRVELTDVSSGAAKSASRNLPVEHEAELARLLGMEAK